ncbi:hypothetical protein [Flavobacterium piscis]|uniref:Uncharacterized protein n=1 Tax=Flavobacterium piscis TaxID=1114874 RepID=A0ABU1Y5W0_9FLAO|nr:hypothetical protein [Flavobacterium piscis]MDR7209616.1 hypothetical protein [Flavobacterium piscis]
MKRNIIILFLGVLPYIAFGQTTFSKDIHTYIKNERDYNKKSNQVVKDVLKNNNERFGVDYPFYTFKTIPTFKIDKKYLTNDVDSLMLNLKIDKNILLDEILIINKPSRNFSNLVGFTFCDSDILDFYLFDDDPEKFKKMEKVVEQFIFPNTYDLVFKIENYPQFWFFLKDNQVSLYSFIDEMLYADKKEIEVYLKNNPPILNVKHSHKPKPCHNEIKIINQSNKIITTVETYFNKPEVDFEILPEIRISDSKNTLTKNNTTRVYAYESCFENFIKPLDKGFITIYILDAQILKTKGWDYIKDNKLFLKRYDLKLKELNNMNWTIIFDGK